MRPQALHDAVLLEDLGGRKAVFDLACDLVLDAALLQRMGNQNPWDATRFIQYAIEIIGGRPTPEATEILQKLIADHAPTYANRIKHVLHLQRRTRRDFEYSSPTIAEFRAVICEALPENVDDLRAWFAERLEEFRKQVRGSDTNMREAYWNDTGEPRNEEYCRDRLIEHVSGPLPESIRFGPEARMPARPRADIVLARNAMKLPVEIKGQWEKNVWNAVNDQLDVLTAVHLWTYVDAPFGRKQFSVR